MGVILYLIIWVLGFIDESSDLVNICFLVSIDSVAVMLLIHLRIMTHRRRQGV